MNYRIDRHKGVAAYIQLYDHLKSDIVNKVYSYGERLPSKRTLASESGVSDITVRHAYELLHDEGYVEPRERSGFFVAFKSEDGFAASGTPLKQSVRPNFSVSETMFPYSVLAKTMRRVMSDYAEAILDKSPNPGCKELRDALRLYLARNRNIHAQVEQIIIGSGAEYLYSMLAGVLGVERIFAIESPSYDKIEQVYSMARVKCDLLPLGSDGIESAALLKTHADVLHITPYRSYPSGVTASASKKYEYIRWACQNDRYIIEDDFESEFSLSSKPEETLFSLSGDENVIYLNTFSKTISPSFRVGYMVLPQKLVRVFSERLGFYSCTVPTFEQFVLAELINRGDFERHINRVRRAKRKGA